MIEISTGMPIPQIRAQLSDAAMTVIKQHQNMPVALTIDLYQVQDSADSHQLSVPACRCRMLTYMVGDQVKMRNVSIMIPRDSWSPEHLIIYSPQVRVLMPITAACLDSLRPDLDR